MEEHPDSIIIIELLDIDNTNLSSEEIHRLAIEYPNLYFDFYKMSEFRIMSNQYTEQKYMYHYPITSWVELNYILHFPGLHAITIGEPLIFDIQKVRTLVDKSRENIQLRAHPAIGRPSMYNDFPGDTGLCHFWVLPQHCSIYDPYIDRVSYFLQDVCVDEKFRGQDIATKMIDKVKEIAKKRNVESVMLTCNKKRKESFPIFWQNEKPDFNASGFFR